MNSKFFRCLSLLLVFGVAQADHYGPVNAHESLWQIARIAQPGDDVTVQQTMLAILKKNPQAFTENNVNGLKKGTQLTLPDKREAGDVSPWRAISLIREQNHLWQQLHQNVQSAQPAVTANNSLPTPPEASPQVTMVYVEESPITEQDVAAIVSTAPQSVAMTTETTDMPTIEVISNNADTAQSAEQSAAKIDQAGTAEHLSPNANMETVQSSERVTENQSLRTAEQFAAVQKNAEQLANIEALEKSNQSEIEALHRKINYLIAYAKALQSRAGKAISEHGHLHTYFKTRWRGISEEPHIPMAFVSATLAILILYAVGQMSRGRQIPCPSEEEYDNYQECENEDEDEDLGDEYDFMGSSEGIPAKLDLARAYIDMQDSVAAKQVLQEVLASGDDAQKADAQALMDKINKDCGEN